MTSSFRPTGNSTGKKFTRIEKDSGFEADNPYSPINKMRQQGIIKIDHDTSLATLLQIRVGDYVEDAGHKAGYVNSIQIRKNTAGTFFEFTLDNKSTVFASR